MIKKRYFFWIVIVCGTMAKAGPPCTNTLTSFEKDHPLKLKVEQLETGIQRDREDIMRLGGLIESLTSEMQSVHLRWGLIQKYFYRWLVRVFGVSLETVDTYKALSQQIETYAEISRRGQNNISTANNQILQLIMSWLNANDVAFNELKKMQMKFYEVVCAGDKCLRRVQQAIEAVDIASGDDQLGHYVDKSFLMWRAANGLRTAIHAAESVDEAMGLLRQHLALLKTDLMDPEIQFAIDILSVRHLTTLINHFSLLTTKRELQELAIELQNINKKMTTAHQALMDQILSKIRETRDRCRCENI
jgi:hypothetical protein